MRMMQRGQMRIEIAPRAERLDALGGVIEDFSLERRAVDALVAPAAEGYRNHKTGLMETQTCGLLMDGNVSLVPGDGICMGTERPQWRVYEVRHWQHHTAAALERIGGMRAP